jgi:surface antigen/cell division protein FtsB
MKHRSTTPPVSKNFLAQSTLVAMSVLVASAGIIQLGSTVLARNYEAEIQAKEQEAQQYANEADRLGAVAATLAEAVSQLQGQITEIQGHIDASQKKHDELVAEIARNEKLIQSNREALGDILSAMYVDDQISPLEMLASSKSIGDYIDKQEQRSSLRSSLNDKIKEIKQLQKTLEENKKAVENVIQDQQAQRSQLDGKKAEQQKLLSDTQNDESAYQRLVGQKRSEIEQIRADQAEANRRALQSSGGGSVNVPAGVAGGGGYPGEWAFAPLDAYVDPWGLYTRECVSYVAWKIWSTGRYVPHFAGAGNANQWPSTAARHGIPSGSTPKVGSAAVMMAGYYGHVMYVEAVHGDGTITVSDYNFAWDGLYRKYDRSASGLTYVYF